MKQKKDGLDPLTRDEIQQLQIDIAKSYEEMAIVGRVLGRVTIAFFAEAAYLSMVVSYL